MKNFQILKILDSNPENMFSIGIVVDILIDYGVEGFKVCKENIHMADAIPKEYEKYKYAQRGKQITIYDYNNIFGKKRADTWTKILLEITVAFIKNKIKPSYMPPYYKRISGSSFISYRNDAGLKGNKRSTEYNPSKESDPFAKISFSHIKDQPDAPKWKNPEKKSMTEPNLNYCSKK